MASSLGAICRDTICCLCVNPPPKYKAPPALYLGGGFTTNAISDDLFVKLLQKGFFFFVSTFPSFPFNQGSGRKETRATNQEREWLAD